MLRKALLGLALTALAFPAAAQSVCSERGEFIEQLSKRYSESPVALGLVSNGSVLEVLASEKGSWTIIVTMPNGVSCVVAAGEAWEDVERLVMGSGV